MNNQTQCLKTKSRLSFHPPSLLAFVFFFSGFSSLIYQVVWQRLLTVYYGVGAISIALIVSVYMFGLGIGALLGGFLAEKMKDKIFFYFIIELLIGCFGLISLPLLDFLGRHTAGSNYLTALFCMCLYLCLPTLLMGMTLPLLTKIFNGLIQDFGNTVSFLYFINTLGAALGALGASYGIISLFGLDTAVYVAAVINFGLAALIFLARSFPGNQEEEKKWGVELPQDSDAIFGKAAYFLVFITGFLAIGYEIAWFRIVGVLVKDSPYAFSTVLAIYLLGIALGSFGMNKGLGKCKTLNKKHLFFLLQFLIGLYVMVIFIGYYYSTKYTFLSAFTQISFSIDRHPLISEIPSLSSIKGFLKDLYPMVDVFFWPMVFVFIPTVFMGASFPLISLLASTETDAEAKTIGSVYFFNIIGNVLGGIVTGFLFLPYLGTELTLLIFSSVGISFGFFDKSFVMGRLAILPRACFAFLLLMINILFFPKAGALYATMHTSPGKEFDAYFEEGRDGVIMTYQHQNRLRNYINGQGHGGRPGYEFYYETIEAMSFAPKTENVLIIGYGTGSITEIVLKTEGIRKVTIVELNSALIKNLKKMPLFERMLADKRLDLMIEDGRRFLLRTPEKFDLILLDPLRTTTSYSNNLYSRQFFKLTNEHLQPGGILMVWMDEYGVMPKTIHSVFEFLRCYNYFCLASDKSFNKNDERQRQLIASFQSQEQEAILEKGKYLGDQDYIKKVTAHYPINEDLKPITEYYIGLKVKEKLFLEN